MFFLIQIGSTRVTQAPSILSVAMQKGWALTACFIFIYLLFFFPPWAVWMRSALAGALTFSLGVLPAECVALRASRPLSPIVLFLSWFHSHYGSLFTHKSSPQTCSGREREERKVRQETKDLKWKEWADYVEKESRFAAAIISSNKNNGPVYLLTADLMFDSLAEWLWWICKCHFTA